ncbi:9483_t:CDS:2 [Entrophospora sp. SA101]|nr:9483_t:CDS:2 [Entrophospora sp. SA101]
MNGNNLFLFDQNAFISISRQPYPTPYASPSKLQQASYEPGIPSSNAAANNNNKKINILEERGTTTATLKRTNKTHVPSACINCKRAHLACDVARPCKRCVALGKVDSCIDIKHKKRGRPKLKDKKPHPYSTHPTADASNSVNSTSNSNLQYYPSSTTSAMYKDNNLYHPYHSQYYNQFVKSDDVFFSQAKDLHCPALGDTIIEVADMIHLKQRNCQHDLYNVRMYLGGGLGAELLRKDTWNKFYVVASFTRVKNGINHTINSTSDRMSESEESEGQVFSSE